MKNKIRKITLGTILGIIAMTIALIGYLIPWYIIDVNLDVKQPIPIDDKGNTVDLVITTNGFKEFLGLAIIKTSIKNPIENITPVINTSQLQQYGLSENDTQVQEAIQVAKQNLSKNAGFLGGMDTNEMISLPGSFGLDDIIMIFIIVGFLWGIFKFFIADLSTRRRKFIKNSISVLLPIIIVVIIMTQILPMFLDRAGSVANILNNMAASPLNGEGSTDTIGGQPATLGLRWALGPGGYLFIISCATYIIAAILVTMELKAEATKEAEKKYVKMVEDSKTLLRPLKVSSPQKPPTIVKLPPLKPTKASDFLGVDTPVQQKEVRIPTAQQIPAAAKPATSTTVPTQSTVSTTSQNFVQITPLPAQTPPPAKPAKVAPLPAKTPQSQQSSKIPPAKKTQLAAVSSTSVKSIPPQKSPTSTQGKPETLPATLLHHKVHPKIPPKKKEEDTRLGD
jgi:hypothetical protein